MAAAIGRSERSPGMKTELHAAANFANPRLFLLNIPTSPNRVPRISTLWTLDHSHLRNASHLNLQSAICKGKRARGALALGWARGVANDRQSAKDDSPTRYVGPGRGAGDSSSARLFRTRSFIMPDANPP